MRFRVDVATDVPTIPWKDVFGPARGVAYELIRSHDAELAAELHDRGYAGGALRPLGLSAPCFRGTSKQPGVYSTSGDGRVWFGSPVPTIAAALLAGAAIRRDIRWGSVPLNVRGIQLEPLPDHSAGETIFTTVTPVLVKFEDRYLHPDHPQFAERLLHNTQHKADVLKLPNEVEMDVLSAGPPRKFLVQGAPRHGSTVRVRVRAAPRLLDALYEYGLGLANIQGFGWIE